MPFNKVIQVGRKGHIRKTTSHPDPVVLPKRLGRHTGIRAWLAHLELAYIGNNEFYNIHSQQITHFHSV